MSLYLIKGQYRIVHSEPDGDSVHFIPDNPDAFTSLHLNARLGSGGAAQLRLDAIDALETHYTPSAHGAKTMHQPLELAHAARSRLLELLGFSDVVRTGETVTSAPSDATTSGATITTLDDLTDRLVIMPKLFRRLAEYFALSVGSVSLDGFAAFMASRDDRLYVISDAHATGFDNVITVAGQTVNLDKEITDLIFTEG